MGRQATGWITDFPKFFPLFPFCILKMEKIISASRQAKNRFYPQFFLFSIFSTIPLLYKNVKYISYIFSLARTFDFIWKKGKMEKNEIHPPGWREFPFPLFFDEWKKRKKMEKMGNPFSVNCQTIPHLACQMAGVWSYNHVESPFWSVFHFFPRRKKSLRQ